MVPSMGKYLILAGALLLVAGILVSLNVRVPWLGRLPGDIRVQKEGFSFYFPFTTCLLLSLVLTFVLRFFKK